jgi:hypothetical protein
MAKELIELYWNNLTKKFSDASNHDNNIKVLKNLETKTVLIPESEHMGTPDEGILKRAYNFKPRRANAYLPLKIAYIKSESREAQYNAYLYSFSWADAPSPVDSHISTDFERGIKGNSYIYQIIYFKVKSRLRRLKNRK